MAVVVQNQLNAQHSNLKDTVLNGKKYLVYPYKMMYARYESNIADIPPILDSLPDGEYVLIKKKKKKEIPRAYFSIQRGKLNGKATFYSHKGILMKQGAYKDGLQDGQWLKYYLNGQIDLEENFSSGVENGPYKANYYLTGKLAKEGIYSMGKKEGEWKIYFDNGDIKSSETFKNGKVNGPSLTYDYAHLKKKVTKHYLKKEVNYVYGKCNGLVKLYDYDDTHTFLKEEFYVDNNSTGFPYEDNDYNYHYKKLSSFHKYYKSYYPNGNIQLEAYSDSITTLLYQDDYYEYDVENDPGLQKLIPSYVPYTIYYPNGKLFGKFKNKTAVSFDFLIKNDFDSIFYSDGKIMNTKFNINDSVGKKRFVLNYYDTNAVLEQTEYYAIDTTYKCIRTKAIKCSKNGCEIFHINNEFFLKEQLPFLKHDSIYLLEYQKTKGRKNTSITKKYLSPISSNFVLIQKEDGDRSIDFEILQYDSIFRVKKTARFGDLTFVGYHNKNNADYNPNLMNVGEIFFEDPFEELGKEMAFADSVFVYYKNQPFTGKIKIKGNIRNKKIQVMGHHITFNVNPDYDGREKAELLCEKGQIIKSKVTEYDFFESTSSEFNFSNQLADGPYTYHYQIFLEEDDLEKSTFSKGLKNGECTEWTGDFKKYISRQCTYVNGIIVGIDRSFYQKNIPEETITYDEEGVKNGPEITYFENGKIDKFTMNKNNIAHGLSYTLTEWNSDTITSIAFSEGVHHGRYFKIIPPYNSIYSWKDAAKKGLPVKLQTLTASFNKGQLQNLQYYDHFKVCRLKIVADSSSDNISVASFYDFNKWDDIAVKGEVKLFHPNGNLYATGKTKIKPAHMPQQLSGKAKDKELYHGMYDDYYTKYHLEKSEKTGLWTYYNSAGRKINEVDYSTPQKIIGKDTIRFDAYYKEFYPSGALKYMGLLYDEAEKTDCESDLKELRFDFLVEYYLSENGDTLVKNGNGKMKHFFKNGKLESEYEIENGNKNGWYKQYNEEGKLVKVGKYVSNDKEGRWLSGDLTGIHYLDEQCFSSPEFKQAQQQKVMNEIKIEETVFSKGLQISYKTYYFTRTY